MFRFNWVTCIKLNKKQRVKLQRHHGIESSFIIWTLISMRFIPVFESSNQLKKQKQKNQINYKTTYAALLRHAIGRRSLIFTGNCICDVTLKQ